MHIYLPGPEEVVWTRGRRAEFLSFFRGTRRMWMYWNKHVYRYSCVLYDFMKTPDEDAWKVLKWPLGLRCANQWKPFWFSFSMTSVCDVNVNKIKYPLWVTHRYFLDVLISKGLCLREGTDRFKQLEFAIFKLWVFYLFLNKYGPSPSIRIATVLYIRG